RGLGGQRIAQLNPNGPPGNQFSPLAWGLMPSDKAVVFLQNHDTQHQCGISYRDGNVFRVANVWTLAQPYGYPSILSSYAFDCPAGNSMGPPSDAAGNTNSVTCASSLETATIGQWVCEHRDPYIRNMVRFRRGVRRHVVCGRRRRRSSFSPRGQLEYSHRRRDAAAMRRTISLGLCATLAAAAAARAQTPAPAWTRGAVCYEVFVRSFYDSDGDGIGDLNGLIRKLGFINRLGASCIWLMPVAASPSYHGYDASAYYRVDPAYAPNDDLK